MFPCEEVTQTMFLYRLHDSFPQAYKLSQEDLSWRAACPPYICYLHWCVRVRYWFMTHPLLIYRKPAIQLPLLKLRTY